MDSDLDWIRKNLICRLDPERLQCSLKKGKNVLTCRIKFLLTVIFLKFLSKKQRPECDPLSRSGPELDES
jgi:hypothetical protein